MPTSIILGNQTYLDSSGVWDSNTNAPLSDFLDEVVDQINEDVQEIRDDFAGDIAVLEGRMDEFASLPPGSTSGNAELVDIRVGASGTTAADAGSSVRGQIKTLKGVVDGNFDTVRSGWETYKIYYQGDRPIANPQTINTNANRVTSDWFNVSAGNLIVLDNIPTGYKAAVGGKYDDGATFNSSWQTSRYFVTVLKSGKFFVNAATSAGTTAIKPYDVPTITVKVYSIDYYFASNDRLKALDAVFNTENNYVNYGYDTSGKYEAVSGSTSYTSIGIERNGQIVTLDGTGFTSSPKLVIKLNGTLERTYYDTPISSGTWVASVKLKSGCRYTVRSELLSGSVSGTADSNVPAVSVYKSGSATSSGTNGFSSDGKIATRVVDGDGGLYNIALYVAANKSFSNAKILVTIQEDNLEADPVSAYFDSKINTLHHLIDYGYTKTPIEYAQSSDLSSGSSVGVKAMLANVTLNYAGTDNTNYAKRVKLTGGISRVSGESTYKNWVGSLQLQSGIEYGVTLQKLSGTAMREGSIYTPTIVVYETNGSSTIATIQDIDSNQCTVKFIAPSGPVTIAIYIAYNAILTNLTVDVSAYEWASEIEDDVKEYYKEELRDTVNKVRLENDEPALVFPWSTDIHRYSVTTQTFLNMIINTGAFMKEVECDLVLNTGDTIEGNQAQSVSLGYAYDSTASFKNIGKPFFYVGGNHDNNPYISSGALTFTLKQVYSAFYSATKDVTFNVNENGTDYYFDFNGLGVRFICLNSCNSSVATTYAFGDSTASWLTQALNTDKSVILASHVSPVAEHVWNNTSPVHVSDVKSALISFVNGGGKLIVLTGHSHVDAEYVDPFVEVTDAAQKFENFEPTSAGYLAMSGQINGIRVPYRTAGTYTEDAWSVVVFKPISNELSVIRFGAGVDRYFHCTPISPRTLTTRFSGTVTWYSSNTSVATVSNGVVTAVGAGRCAVFAKDAEGNMEIWVIVIS